ncbi:MAG: PASTA domain-containing protein [Clostridia bacterium]|nr:PASTA domain-containing protein [Clostridia bacterium]
MSCMKEIGDLKQCPHCGFHADSPQIAPYLPIRTVLGNRYLVGKLLEYNGDGATYMGLDLSTRTSVNIREFFPEGLAVRDSKTLAVSAPDEHATLFNECLHSFVEMWRKLMRLSGLSALIKVQDVLEGNGTCYAVTENVDGLSLREYLLRNNAGYISWEKARPLLMPVLSTLGTLHSSGIIHRGISPSTLIVATDGKIRITGFSISQVRSARSELKTQLYNGYAAFEQYGFDGRQGSWTDIYGFGAVLYRTLIGTDPIDATERVTNDRLMVPGKFAEQLPAYVINGLVNALQILPEDRTRSVEELRAELSASPSAAAGASPEFEHTAKQPKYQTMAQRIETEEDDYTAEKREAAQKRHHHSSIIIAVASVIIVLAVAFLVLWQTGVIDLGGTTTTAAQEEMISVPNFVGKAYTDILDDPYYSRNFKFEKSEVYSSTIEEGVVISQSAGVDSQIAKNSVIKLTVSKGKEIVTFPTSGINGTKYEDAANLLKKMGFTVYKTEKLNNENQVAGNVSGFSLEAGGQYEKGTVVYLFVWGEPETTTTTTTEPTDSNNGSFWDDWFNQNNSSDDSQSDENGY